MHEISLVQGLIQQLHTIARENNTTRILKITMGVGPLSGVVIESFQFGFDILSKEDDLVRGAELVIDIPEVTYRCSSCGNEQVTDGPKPEECPECTERLLIAEGGQDLILQQVEME
jgi:hydrogenase nickel insertion protein HypA